MNTCSRNDAGAIASGGIAGDLESRSDLRRTARRQFLKSLGALGAGAVLPCAAVLLDQAEARGAAATPNRIDVHHHHISPTIRKSTGPGRVTQISDPSLLNWAPAIAVEQMDKVGIATAMLSMATGGTPSNMPGEPARSLARESNEYAAQLARTSP